ncbi:MAG: SagB/ThcOx family dehydrogenase [Gemmatimonadales bacterium]|nr:SagB/ThcOx family dehydrogenase [Gemmatimonadales bacterium]
MKSTSVHLVGLFLLGAAPALAQEPQAIQLPSPQTEIGRPLMQALTLRQSTRSFATRPLDLQELSNLLWAADGINRPESGGRTAPSARGWHEIDIYVALPEALYRYDPPTHALRPAVAGDLRPLTGVQTFVAGAPLNLVYVADRSRQGNASEEDKERYNFANAGLIAQNVYLYCASQGLVTVVRALIDRPALAEAMALRPEQHIILAQTVGYPN